MELWEKVEGVEGWWRVAVGEISNPPPNPPPYDLYYKLVIISIVLIYNNKKVEGYNKVKK